MRWIKGLVNNQFESIVILKEKRKHWPWRRFVQKNVRQEMTIQKINASKYTNRGIVFYNYVWDKQLKYGNLRQCKLRCFCILLRLRQRVQAHFHFLTKWWLIIGMKFQIDGRYTARLFKYIILGKMHLSKYNEIKWLLKMLIAAWE